MGLGIGRSFGGGSGEHMEARYNSLWLALGINNQ